MVVNRQDLKKEKIKIKCGDPVKTLKQKNQSANYAIEFVLKKEKVNVASGKLILKTFL